MQAACYVLDLYCDHEGCRNGPHGSPAEAQYTHELGSSCRRIAREDGWKVSASGGTDLCPRCAKERA